MNAPLTNEQLTLLSSNTVAYRSTPVQTGSKRGAKPGLFEMVANAIRWVAEFPRRRAVLDELGRLTDRELNDIGLTRSELRQVFARHG